MKIYKIIASVLVALAFLSALIITIRAEEECETHSFGEYVSNEDSTCETDGTKTATCSVCGATTTTADVGSKGHLTDSSWQKDKFEHWKVCKICGKSVEASKNLHTYAEFHELEATHNAQGRVRYECTFCHYSYTEDVPKLIKEKNPTGAIVAISIAGVSLSALCFIIAFRKPSIKNRKK
jgi:hypothetical protein